MCCGAARSSGPSEYSRRLIRCRWRGMYKIKADDSRSDGEEGEDEEGMQEPRLAAAAKERLDECRSKAGGLASMLCSRSDVRCRCCVCLPASSAVAGVPNHPPPPHERQSVGPDHHNLHAARSKSPLVGAVPCMHKTLVSNSVRGRCERWAALLRGTLRGWLWTCRHPPCHGSLTALGCNGL